MMFNRRMAMGAVFAVAVAVPGKAQTPPSAGDGVSQRDRWQSDEMIELWPDGAPGMPSTPIVETIDERSTDPLLSDRAAFGISNPRMMVFRPENPNGAAIIIMPGGGYRRVVIDKEGYELGSWLSARGVTAFVLIYRLPGEGWASGPNVALADAQRAIRLIRQRAKTYSIDPERVAAMGFSAGGHLCCDLTVRFAFAAYKAIDDVDLLSARPCLSALIYPVVSMSPPDAHLGSREKLLGANPGPALEHTHSPHRHVPANAPPIYLVHAEDDRVVPVENTLLLRAAFRAQNIPVETHLFTEGGHGFGIRKTVGKPVSAWPQLFIDWGKAMGWLA